MSGCAAASKKAQTVAHGCAESSTASSGFAGKKAPTDCVMRSGSSGPQEAEANLETGEKQMKPIIESGAFASPAFGAKARVLAVLRASGEPLPAIEISRLAGVPQQQVRNHLTHLLSAGQIANVGKPRVAVYTALAVPKMPEAPAVPHVVPWRDTTLSGAMARPVRTGAEAFLSCPHLINGERVERTRPAIISSRQL